MKRKLLSIICALLLPVVGFSQSSPTDIIKQLSEIEGYVFIGKGESRDLSRTFSRTDSIFEGAELWDLQEHDWSSINPSIVKTSNEGLVTGENYGETIVKVNDGDSEHSLLVFVCPKITIKSPEGAIYSHHKIYGQPVKIRFSQSKTHSINCITMNGEDVTDLVTSEDGFFVSDFDATENLTFIITMEDRQNDDVISDSHIRILTDGYKCEVTGVMDLEGMTIKNLKNKGVAYTISRNIITFSEPGIYLISDIPGANGSTYKVIID